MGVAGIAKPLAPRFWALVERTDGCWPFRGTLKPNGYGKIYGAGQYWNAHRLAWTLANGPIPVGLCVCHRCDNPPCCNPAHLFLGTRSDNMQDAKAKGRAAPSPFGTPAVFAAAMAKRHTARGSRIASSRLTEIQVAEIRRLLPHHNNASIGRMYGVRRATIRRIRVGITWMHVSEAPP